MALKLLNDKSVGTTEERNGVAVALAQDLKLYVDLFSEDVRNWVKDKSTITNAEGKKLSDIELSALKNRIWLREMVMEFKETAKALLGYDEDGNSITDSQGNVVLDPVPDWQPDWIKAY